MLRTAQQHHVQLSALADQKASILIGACLVVLTLILGRAASGTLSPAIVVLAITAFLSAVFAVLVVIPTTGQVAKGESNPLFFGSFVHWTRQEYMKRLNHIIESDRDVYTAMMTDIYQMGQVLHRRKYRYLRVSYRLFLVGLLITGAVAVVEYFGVSII